jgi:sugar phosphate isomerase/epimerase
MLDDNELRCCGTHTRLDTLTGDNLAKTIEFNKIIGNNFLIVPSLDQKTHTTKEAWLNTAKVFNGIAAKLKPEDMMVGYHNHAWDLTPIEGEKPLDIFLENTSKDVIMQLDIGHAVHGGADPVAYLKKYPGRAVTVHLKEYSATNNKALIGEGDVKWKDVLAACESTGGTQWYIIEEESGAYPPLEAAEMSLKNYKKLRT